MTLEFAFSSDCNAPQIWIWFPGWGFKAEIFNELAHRLPGQHYWYRWSDCSNFNQAVDDICTTLPDNAILVGWSLGGAIAEAVAHRLPAPAALITLATAPKFCRSEQWPYGMPQLRFDSFVASFKDNAHKTLMRFLALAAQGIDKPKAIIRYLDHQQLEPSAALLTQLLWLDQYDFTGVDKAKCLCLHLFAEHDALVAPPHSHGQGHFEIIADACHALFIQKPELIQGQLLNIYAQLNSPEKQATSR